MYIDTVRFHHLLGESDQQDIHYFLSRAAFIICHKSESMETLSNVLWYLPTQSPIIIVTNCPEQQWEKIQDHIKDNFSHYKRLYLIHQKDDHLAHFLQSQGVEQILGSDGKVRDGKGEGMYIGALCSVLLGYPQWVVYFDADNLVPCALLEYMIALGRLFLSANSTDSLPALGQPAPLHNIRICWSSKPSLQSGKIDDKVLGRCTRVISPIFQGIVEAWFGQRNKPLVCSNAGEQAMTIETVKTLRFSSGFSIETFQLIDFIFRASPLMLHPAPAVLQQYQSKSPHFHTKRDDEHIKRMIAVSLGSFLTFQEYLPPHVVDYMQRICNDLDLRLACPVIYPSLESLELEGNGRFVARYKLGEESVIPLETPIA